jgi:hypothetical protein
MGFVADGIATAMEAAVTGPNMFIRTLNQNPIRLATLLLAGIVSTSSTEATVLNPGAKTALYPAHEPQGAHLLAVTNYNFSAASLSGKLMSKVWADDEANPFGGLTFSYRLVNTGECDDSLGWFSLGGFAGLSVDVNYFTGGVAPRIAQRSVSGAVVSFGFFDRNGDETFEPGDSSAWLIVQTSAHDWCVNQLVGVDTEMVAAATFTPVAVPEPASVSIVAFAGLVLWARRTPRK